MVRGGLFATGVLLIVAGPAFAQDASRAEISAGWRQHHVTITSVVRPLQVEVPNDYPKGWYADAAVNVSEKFAIVAEAAGSRFEDAFEQPSNVVSIRESLDVEFYTFMGGVRVRAPQTAWAVPFGQVLFGGVRNTSVDERTITVFQTTSTTRQEETSSDAALALDGGVTLAIGRIGVRASVGYARFFGTADADAFRLSLGAAFRF
ncbi:MAG TPA: hypothetical protein VFB85_26445 [Vicinamibacterales bacterium]|nr:hypothetical protein [Vicinamibacterales bacterium]